MPALFKRSNGINCAVVVDEARRRRASTPERRKTNAVKKPSSLLISVLQPKRWRSYGRSFQSGLPEEGGGQAPREALALPGFRLNVDLFGRYSPDTTTSVNTRLGMRKEE
jgi:hypothetical protein